MGQTLHTTDEVIDKLGGTARCQRRYRQKGMSNVSNWRSSGKFPPNTFHAMSSDLAAIGCEASPSLWQQIQPDPTVEGFPSIISASPVVIGEEGGTASVATAIRVASPEVAS